MSKEIHECPQCRLVGEMFAFCDICKVPLMCYFCTKECTEERAKCNMSISNKEGDQIEIDGLILRIGKIFVPVEPSYACSDCVLRQIYSP